MTTPRPLGLLQNDNILRVKSTGAIYCAAQSTQVANDILRRHNSFDAMKAALETAQAQLQETLDMNNRNNWFENSKVTLEVIQQALTLAEGKE